MSGIIASCYHEISEDWFNDIDSRLLVKGKTSDGSEFSYPIVVCPECLELHKKSKLVIKDGNEQKK